MACDVCPVSISMCCVKFELKALSKAMWCFKQEFLSYCLLARGDR
jgi:hypothetical protein